MSTATSPIPTPVDTSAPSSPPQTDYAAALQRYHSQLRDRILDGIWADHSPAPLASGSNSRMGSSSTSNPASALPSPARPSSYVHSTPIKGTGGTRRGTPLSPSALALLANQPTRGTSKPGALGSWDRMMADKHAKTGSNGHPPQGQALEEPDEELGLRTSKRIINPLTQRPYTRSEASSGKTRSIPGLGANEMGSGSATATASGSGSGTYIPVKSLASVGGSLGSRGRRDHESGEDRSPAERDERRSSSRSTEVRRIPGLSRERPRSGEMQKREVSAWSSSESDSSFQSTPRSWTDREERAGRSRRASARPYEHENAHDVDDDERSNSGNGNPVVMITSNTSPSPAPGSVRGKVDKDISQIIDYSLPLRSPTVFPVSYRKDEVTGEKTERKLPRGAKVQALGLGLTAMTPTPGSSPRSSTSTGKTGSRPASAVLTRTSSTSTPSTGPSFVDGIKNASASEIGSAFPTPAESEDSFAAIAPSPLWTPSVNPLIRGRNSATEGAPLVAGEQPFWSIGNDPLVSRKGMFRRTLSGLSTSRWDVENDCEAPVENDEDDGLVSDGRDVGFMDDLLEDYQLAHPPTPAAALSRSNSYLGKAFGMTAMRPVIGRGGSYASDKENRSLQSRPLATKTSVQHVETRVLAATMGTGSDAPIPSPKARRNNSDGAPASTAPSPESQRRMFRMVRKLTFQRPHHKDGRGKGRGGDWTRECGEAI